LLSFSHVNKYFGAEHILRDVSFRVGRGDRVALVGPNGAGKSTILRVAVGVDQPDDGAVTLTRDLRLAYLAQQPDLRASQTVYDVMLDAFRHALDARAHLQSLEGQMSATPSPELVAEYGDVQARVEHAGYDHTAQIERVLTGLQIDSSLWHAPVSELSGGQHTRVYLGRTLVEDADLLLLDEPTNHLDIQAVEWLESYLRDLKRAYIVIAHDRYLLDRVTTRTLELSAGRVTSYNAPYSRYLRLRDERTERQRLEYRAQQEHIDKTEEFVRRFGAGQRSREARGRQKQLDRLERIERPRDAEQVMLAFGSANRSGDVVLRMQDLRVGYADNVLVDVAGEVTVRRGERVAIIGANGSGKTTLLRTLTGDLPALRGSAPWGANTTRGYYSQTLEQLNETRTVLEEIQHAKPISEQEARAFLARFLFRDDDVEKRIGILSGGERSRVALAMLILKNPNVLLLDEPTNHLDISSREALQAVLNEFQGTMIFVSHDRALIDALAQQVWVVQSGGLTRYTGNYSAYTHGSAIEIDRVQSSTPGPQTARVTTTQTVYELEAEAEILAGELAAAGATAPVHQLLELMDRYSQTQRMLQEAQGLWIGQVREQIRAYSA